MSVLRELFHPRSLHYGCADNFFETIADHLAAREPLAMTHFARDHAVATQPKRVGFIGVDGTSSFDLGALELFAAARTTEPKTGSRRCYEPLVIGFDSKTFAASSGAVIKAHYTATAAPMLDTIVIPGAIVLRNSEVGRQIALWLAERAKTARRIAVINAGIYPLASTGLLNGRTVTTHWRLAPDVARSFPALTVSSGAAFVKADAFYSCGGGIAGAEMSLALIEEDYGAETALAVARELSIDLRPPGAPHPIPLPQHEAGPAERLAELPTWILARLHRDLTVEMLAERACLSPRHFSRLFKQAFKSTPAAFIERLRVEEARRRLAARRENVESVANLVGFKSSTVFRRAFERRLGVSPSSVLRTSALAAR